MNRHNKDVKAPSRLILVSLTLPRSWSDTELGEVAVGGYHGVLGAWPRSLAPPLALLLSSSGSAIKERGRGLGASSILGSSRRDVAYSGGSRQDGVCGKFRGSSTGRDSLRAVPSGTVGRERVSEGRSASSRKRSRRGGAHLNQPESGSLSLRILCSAFNLVPLWLSCLQVSKWVVNWQKVRLIPNPSPPHPLSEAWGVQWLGCPQPPTLSQGFAEAAWLWYAQAQQKTALSPSSFS